MTVWTVSRAGAPIPRIAAVKSVSSPETQALLGRVAGAWKAAGLRVAGAVQETAPIAPGGLPTKVLRDLTTGALHPVLQDLGPASTACCVDPGGLAAACAGIEKAVRQGCDVVIISKFGKLEAERGGLLDAFGAAIEMDAPVVTSVSPRVMEPWAHFAGSLAAFIAPELGAIESWRAALASECAVSAAF
jgi:hypothetical protein